MEIVHIGMHTIDELLEPLTDHGDVLRELNIGKLLLRLVDHLAHQDVEGILEALQCLDALPGSPPTY